MHKSFAVIVKCSEGNRLLCPRQQNKLAAGGERRTNWNVWLRSLQARSSAHLQRAVFRRLFATFQNSFLVFSSFLLCERNKLTWKVLGMNYFCRSFSLEGKWKLWVTIWVCLCEADLSLWEKKNWCPPFLRAAQGTFLSPLLSWEIATDVGYCEASQNVILKTPWRERRVLNSSKEEQTPRASGAHPVTLFSENRVPCCPPMEGGPRNCDGTDHTDLALSYNYWGCWSHRHHTSTFPLGEWVLWKQLFPKWKWLGLQGFQTAWVLVTLCQSSWHSAC